MDTSGLFFRPGAMNALETLDPDAAVVHGAGHSVQSHSPGGAGRRAVQRFLLGQGD